MVGRWQQPATSKKPQHDESGVMQGRHGEDGVHIGVQQVRRIVKQMENLGVTGSKMGSVTGERNQEAAMLGTDGNGPIVRKDARSRTGQAMIERNQEAGINSSGGMTTLLGIPGVDGRLQVVRSAARDGVSGNLRQGARAPRVPRLQAGHRKETGRKQA